MFHSKLKKGKLLPLSVQQAAERDDVDTVGQSLTQSLGNTVTSITMLLGTLIMMFYTNWLMTIAGVVVTIIGFVLMMVIVSKSQIHFPVSRMSLEQLTDTLRKYINLYFHTRRFFTKMRPIII